MNNELEIVVFFRQLKNTLVKMFPENNWGDVNTWHMSSGTCGWCNAVQEASLRTTPELWELYGRLVWWMADFFDEWIVECAKHIGLCDAPMELKSWDKEDKEE